MVNDKAPLVRIAVAEQGYALYKLINDKNSDVRRAAAKAICERLPKEEVNKYIDTIVKDRNP